MVKMPSIFQRNFQFSIKIKFLRKVQTKVIVGAIGQLLIQR